MHPDENKVFFITLNRGKHTPVSLVDEGFLAEDFSLPKLVHYLCRVLGADAGAVSLIDRV